MLTIENLSRSYGDKVLFHSINSTITEQDRIGLIGVNGTGKSTLLRTIAGIEAPDQGTIEHPRDYRIEYLEQEPELDPNLTVIEQIYYGEAMVMQVMRQYEKALQQLELAPENEKFQLQLLDAQQQMDKHEAWDTSTIAKTILTKFGITDFRKNVSQLSGGQRKRVALAKSLIQPADLLILDEPTNHLDNTTIEWLEQHLATYNGALLLVTHDRYFLNRVTNRIFELDQGNLYIYDGNYELFLEKKAEREALEARSEQKHHNTLRRELAWLQRGARARSTKQKARIERIDELKEQTFHPKNEQLDFKVGSTRLGTQVIELENVSKQFEDQPVIQDMNFLFKRGDKVGIIGPNATGKSTLLNIIAGKLAPDQGKVHQGQTVKIGYYRQGDEELDGNMRIIDYIKEVAQVIHTVDGDEITAEQMLERFLFSRSAQWGYIRRLSGGEKRRLYLLRVLMREPNVLLLDEPTNDLDTQTLSILEEYLNEFPGVVITVSHDRYFLDRVVDQLIVFSTSGKISFYYGSYSEYSDEMNEKEQIKIEKKQVAAQSIKKQKKKLSYLEQQEWNVIEDEIMELEQKTENLQAEIDAAGSNLDEVQRLFAEQQSIEKQVEEKMERWEELSLLVEEYEGNNG